VHSYATGLATKFLFFPASCSDVTCRQQNPTGHQSLPIWVSAVVNRVGVDAPCHTITFTAFCVEIDNPTLLIRWFFDYGHVIGLNIPQYAPTKFTHVRHTNEMGTVFVLIIAD
jgi:hypothetical protein